MAALAIGAGSLRGRDAVGAGNGRPKLRDAAVAAKEDPDIARHAVNPVSAAHERLKAEFGATPTRTISMLNAGNENTWGRWESPAAPTRFGLRPSRPPAPATPMLVLRGCSTPIIRRT